MNDQIRTPMYAGTWYPSERKEIEHFIAQGKQQEKAIAVVTPHAGWLYSGKVNGEVFSSVTPAQLYILIGPNHSGAGSPASVYPSGAWMTPLGELAIESAVAAEIVKRCPFSTASTTEHQQEHSIEVITPFIKYFSPGAHIVPIALSDYRPEICQQLGSAIAEIITERGLAAETLLVASSDMSHYVSASSARKMDMMAIERIIELDPAGLLSTVEQQHISMCGSGPVAAVLWAVLKLGAAKASLLRYTTSAEATGDYDEVVGYAGIVIK